MVYRNPLPPPGRVGLAVALFVGASLSLIGPTLAAGVATRVEAGAERPPRNLYSASAPGLSADGRLVAFWSTADGLVAGDTNRASDVFVKDLMDNTVERVSVAPDGSQANGPSQNAVLSADGRLVAFESRAANLVAGDTNSSADVCVKDRSTGSIDRVSVASDGSQGNGGSYRPSITPDGRYVAFWSEASTLTSNDTNSSYDNGGYDIFVKDRQTGQLERLSVDANGDEGTGDSMQPAISADGRFIVFGSYAPNLIANDQNNFPDVFVKDRVTLQVQRISEAADGSEGDESSFWSPAINSDGSLIGFWSEADNLVPGDGNASTDVFVKNRLSGAIERISTAADGSEANGDSYNAVLSADGRYVAFWSNASNLVPNDRNGQPDIFVKDRLAGVVDLVSVAADGSQGDGASFNPVLTGDGSRLAFWSEATNLVAGDGNGRADVFLVER